MKPRIDPLVVKPRGCPAFRRWRREKAVPGQNVRGIAAFLREGVSRSHVRSAGNVKDVAGEASASPESGPDWQAGGRRRRAKVGLDAGGTTP